MDSSPKRLLLLGLIQDLQKQAVELGLTRTAAALEVTGQVATEEVADSTLASRSTRAPFEEQEGAD